MIEEAVSICRTSMRSISRERSVHAAMVVVVSDGIKMKERIAVVSGAPQPPSSTQNCLL